MNLPVGAIFASRYRVVKHIASGGMGAVYLVEQLSTGRLRALKVMLASFAHDVKGRERFVQEAKIGARIQSSHVVEVIDAGVDSVSAAPWMVMEYLVGQDLEMRLEGGRAIDFVELMDVFEQLGDAMGSAHSLGIVHLDLKPENIFLAQERRRGRNEQVVKVLDFGIARFATERAPAVATSLIGSPLWMAPEQLRRHAVLGPQADVWALGMIAFRALSGKVYWRSLERPEAGVADFFVEAMAGAKDPATIRARALGCSVPFGEKFDAWFARCTQMHPDYRFANASEAVAALRDVASASRPAGTIEWSPPPSGVAPVSPIAHVLPQVAELLEQSRPLEALQALEGLGGEIASDGRALYLLGLAYGRLGMDLEAVKAFGRSLALSPRNAEALWRRARAHERLGNVAAAREDYDSAVELSPDVPLYRWERGACWLSDDPELSLVDFSFAISMDPEEPEYWYSRGVARKQLAMHEDALADFRKAASLGHEGALAELLDRRSSG